MVTHSTRKLGVMVAVMVPTLLLAGCSGGARAGKTIAEYFAAHADELSGGARAIKQEALSFVDDGLRDAEVLAARNAETQAARARASTDSALTKVCHIYVDFSVPNAEDSEDEEQVIELMNAMAAELPGSGIHTWTERLVSAYEAVWAEGDAQKQAESTLLRDAEVAAFQHAYCKG